MLTYKAINLILLMDTDTIIKLINKLMTKDYLLDNTINGNIIASLIISNITSDNINHILSYLYSLDNKNAQNSMKLYEMILLQNPNLLKNDNFYNRLDEYVSSYVFFKHIKMKGDIIIMNDNDIIILIDNIIKIFIRHAQTNIINVGRFITIKTSKNPDGPYYFFRNNSAIKYMLIKKFKKDNISLDFVYSINKKYLL